METIAKTKCYHGTKDESSLEQIQGILTPWRNHLLIGHVFSGVSLLTTFSQLKVG